MKILRDGDVRKVIYYRKFVCPTCKCVFIADSHEYTTVFDHNDYYFETKCPNCNHLVSCIVTEKIYDSYGKEIKF